MNHISERWNRISLRTKITGVTVLMLTLGLLVSGIGTAAMLRSYVEDQMESKLEAIASGDMSKYFETDADRPRAQMNLNQLDFARDRRCLRRRLLRRRRVPAQQLGEPRRAAPSRLPVDPHPGRRQRAQQRPLRAPSRFDDAEGDPTFRAVAALMTADAHGTYVPVIIAISSKDTESLLGAYLTIFLGFGFGVVLVGALLTRMLVTSTFMPLREVERTAAAIADGDFSQRLGGATPNTEVGRLNRSLNTMLNRIDRAFRDRARTIDQMRRFVGDASA